MIRIVQLESGKCVTAVSTCSTNDMQFIYVGKRNMPAQPFLTPAVTNNIKLIRDIQSKYLSAIEDENILECD